ncbi:MAG: hypothetical protein WBB28_02100 [Crinalium sp.]
MAHISLTGQARFPLGSLAEMDMILAVGFGQAEIRKDGNLVYEEPRDEENYKSLSDFEKLARESPESDWTCHLNAPLWSAKWQRQGEDKWVLVEGGEGFA